MTSKRLYAAAALGLSACLPLGACSPADSSLKGESSAGSATPSAASPSPRTVRLSVDQAKAVALLGQRATGSVYPNAPRRETLLGSACGQRLRPSPGSTWLSYATAEPEGQSVPAQDLAKVDVGGAFSAVSVLPDAAAEAALDADLEQWATDCPEEDGPVDPIAIDLEGVDSALAYGLAKPRGSAPFKYASIAIARTGNAQITCQLEAKDAATANAAAGTCVQDMVSGASAIADPLSTPNPLGAKTLLANVVAQPDLGTEVTFADTFPVQPPCGTMDDTFMTPNSVTAAFRSAGTDIISIPQASAGVLALKDPAAAKAMVAQAQRTFGQCSGSFEYQHGPKKVPAQILSVKTTDVGDGGFAITDEIRFPGQKPEPGYTAIFSLGPFVIQVDQWQPGQGELIAKAISQAAL